MKMVTIETCVGRTANFVCDSRNTRNGFAHDVTLFVDGIRYGDGHGYYLNRTWERWTYESACLDCIDRIIADRKDELKDDYKAVHGLTRVAGKHKDALAAIWDNDLKIALMKELRGVLTTKCF